MQTAKMIFITFPGDKNGLLKRKLRRKTAAGGPETAGLPDQAGSRHPRHARGVLSCRIGGSPRVFRSVKCSNFSPGFYPPLVTAGDFFLDEGACLQFSFFIQVYPGDAMNARKVPITAVPGGRARRLVCGDRHALFASAAGDNFFCRPRFRDNLSVSRKSNIRFRFSPPSPSAFSETGRDELSGFCGSLFMISCLSAGKAAFSGNENIMKGGP